ncbi:hypothetical protein [Pirellulimonas nuda]|nr:hypothetical protein [Pirellulimonas nuda]
MSNGSPWRLDAGRAVLTQGALRGHIDLGSPEAGARIQMADADEIGVLWRRTNPGDARSLEEAYVRGPDLVAAYAPDARFPFREEFYWRVDDEPRAAGDPAELSALVSLQTQLLDTSPKVWVQSQWRSEESVALQGPAGAAAVLHRIVGGGLSVIETVDPADVCVGPELTSSEAGASVRWSLNCPFLEKGVIRRARLGIAVTGRDNDVETAQAWLRRFASRAVALTA